MIAAVASTLGSALTVLFTAPVTFRHGYEAGLTSMQTTLDQAGIFTSWELNKNGSYTITFLGSNGMAWSFTTRFDMIIQQCRNGKIISQSMHTMNITDFGKDWVEQQLFTDTNSTDNALYISMSNNETAVDLAWTMLPDEATTEGLARAAGSYASTGTGTANITKTFSVSGTNSTCLYGINAGPYASYPNSLIAAEQQGSGARKNLVAGDTLAITIVWSHS